MGGTAVPTRRRDRFISKTAPDQIVDGIRTAARGEQVVLDQRSQRATIDAMLRWPGRDLGLTERESELLALLPTGMNRPGLLGGS